MSGDSVESLPVEHAELHAEEHICKDCGEAFETNPARATHARYCKPAQERRAREKAEHAGEQPPTPSERTEEDEKGSPYRDGESEPNEILLHILTTFPGVNKAVVTEVMSWADLWGQIPPYYLPYLFARART